jgi:hypothetical protein
MDVTTASYVAYVALIGVLISAIVSLVNGIWTSRYNARNLMWQKEQWTKNKKQEAFFGCLKCLGESMPLPIHEDQHPVSVVDQKYGTPREIYIDNDRFLGLMQSFQYVGSWLTIVEAYCSNDENALRVSRARDKFLSSLNQVLHEEMTNIKARPEGAGEKRYVRRDCGLSKAHKDAYECVMELASSELLIGRVPTLDSSQGN